MQEKAGKESVSSPVAAGTPELPGVESAHVRFDMLLGPLGGNGATPWTASLGLGTPAQRFRFMLDTGTKNTWVTSSACNTQACRVHACFDPARSTTYQGSGEPSHCVSFGPWGEMEVLLGGDVAHLEWGRGNIRAAAVTNERLWIYLATHYEGEQFAALDCDGGLAIPAVECERPSALLQQLYRQGLIAQPLASFYFDPVRGAGRCLMGALDPSRFDPVTVNTLPLKPLSGELAYLWNVPMAQLACGGQVISADSALVLDTGSSRFKGGAAIVERMVKAITDNGRRPREVTDPGVLAEYPDLSVTLGQQAYVLTPSDYFLKVGDSRWELGVHHLEGLPDEMLVVGSVFLDHVYSIFLGSPSTGAGEGVILARPVHPRLSVSGVWHNEFGSTLEIGPVAADGTFTGRYRSDTGASGVYPVMGVADPAPEGDSLAVSFSVSWRSLEGEPDPSWHWVSGFTGLVEREQGVETLHTTYLLQRNVSRDMPDWMATAVYPSVFRRP